MLERKLISDLSGLSMYISAKKLVQLSLSLSYELSFQCHGSQESNVPNVMAVI